MKSRVRVQGQRGLPRSDVVPQRPPWKIGGWIPLTRGGKTCSPPTEDLGETNRIRNKVKRTSVGWCPWCRCGHLKRTVLYRVFSVFMAPLGLFLNRVQLLTLFGWKYTARVGATPAALQNCPLRGKAFACSSLCPASTFHQTQSTSVLSFSRGWKRDRQNHSSRDHSREICHEVPCLFDLARSS